ncbi:Glycoside hydrolase [Mycena sanguinolenta]|uniref:Glycoside hydrolase n=1 Tax=Mycena sanguinolenta TaxID=230812 RepID=A0A8H7DIR3_9AGAR|nr:Glycoside hydrolase [Mycena sanguinolenta]
MSSVALIYAPILFGGAVAFMLSGTAAVQCIIFFRSYSDESNLRTAIVTIVSTLDAAQSAFILVSLFDYFVAHFGDAGFGEFNIPWSIAVAIQVTAMQTCVVHLSYAQEIYLSSKKNWWLTGPIICLASLRLLAAIVATAEMLKLKRWEAFSEPYPRLLFTSGLSLSAGTDVILTICLCYYLRKIRKPLSSSVTKSALDTLSLYTLENGLITCLTTIGHLTLWLVLPSYGLLISLHFVVGKLYPNSLLVLLNTRKDPGDMHARDHGVHIDASENLGTYYLHFPHRNPISHHIDHSLLTAPRPVCGYPPAFQMPKAQLEGKVQRTVTRDSMAISETDSFSMQRAYARSRSPGNTSLHWRALP